MSCFIKNYGITFKKEKMEKTLVDMNGEKICCYIEGTGPVSVLLLCGLGAPMPLCDLFSMYKNLQGIGKIIVMDRFGYANSDITEKPRTIETVVEEIKFVCNELKIKKNLIIVGHSLGSYNTLAFAETYPDMLLGIAIIDCFPLPKKKIWFALNVVFGKGAALAVKKGLLNKLKDESIAKMMFVHDEMPEELKKESYFFCKTKSYNKNIIDELKSSKNDVMLVEKKLKQAKTVPVLSICRKSTVKYSKKIGKKFSDFTILNVGKSSHLIHHDHENLVNDIIKGFCERVVIEKKLEDHV